jgi:hypothetical protein
MVERAYSRGADVGSMMAIVIIDVNSNSHMREPLMNAPPMGYAGNFEEALHTVPAVSVRVRVR